MYWVKNGNDYEVLDGQQRTISICQYVNDEYSINNIYWHTLTSDQHEPNANELWLYFQNVINWVKVIFPEYRKEMKGIAWGELYNKFGKEKFNSAEMEKDIKRLMMDDDITKKSGIYPYLLTKDEKYLNIRAFTDSQKRAAYEKQNGICPPPPLAQNARFL
jgi:hypothetical protein